MDIISFVVSNREAALLVGDYGTYRAQLSRKLAGVRRKLGQTMAKSGKYAGMPKISAEDVGRNHEHIQLLLLTSERARAHAMHMKSIHFEKDSTKGITGTARSHIISRLDKAAKHAKEVSDLLRYDTKDITGANFRDILEAEVYASSLAGEEEFEKKVGGKKDWSQGKVETWRNCLMFFSIARVVCSVLLQSTKNEIYKSYLSSAVDPNIRYAAYQSQLPRTKSVQTISRDYFPKDNQNLMEIILALDPDTYEYKMLNNNSDDIANNSIPTTVPWRAMTANVGDISVGQALAYLYTAEDNLRTFISNCPPDVSDTEKAAAYDDVLVTNQDVVDAIIRAIDDLEKTNIDERDHRMKDLRVTSLALNYRLVGWRVGRNRILVGKNDGLFLESGNLTVPTTSNKLEEAKVVERQEGIGKKLARLRERLVLYDAISQSIESVKDLPGAARDGGFLEELDASRAYFQALKCLNISYSHDLLSHPKNSLALLLRAEQLAARSLCPAYSAKSSSSPPTLEIQQPQALRLRSRLQFLISYHQGLVVLQTATSRGAKTDLGEMKSTTLPPLIERLDQYSSYEATNLAASVNYPPTVQPVPVKPLFLDIAWNYIDYPGKSKAVMVDNESSKGIEKVNMEESKAKRGWLGFGS